MSTDKPTPNEFCQWCYDHGLRYSKAGPWPHAKDCPNNPDRSKPVIDWEAHWIECHWKLTKSIINQIESERQRDEYARQLAEVTRERDVLISLAYETRPGMPIGPVTWQECCRQALKSYYDEQEKNTQLRAELVALREIRAKFVWDHLNRICGECGNDKDEDGNCATCILELLAECPLLHTTTCNQSEIAWIGRAKKALTAEHTPAEETKPERTSDEECMTPKQPATESEKSTPTLTTSHGQPVSTLTSNPAPESPNPSGPQLLPCPFCGSNPLSCQVGDDDGGYWAVECIECPISGSGRFVGVHADEEAAIVQWNQRAKSPDTLRLEATVAEMRAALEKEIVENQKLKFGAVLFDFEMFVSGQLPRLRDALDSAPSGMLEAVREACEYLSEPSKGYPTPRERMALALLAPYCPQEAAQQP